MNQISRRIAIFLVVIALTTAFGIVGYIAWDVLRSRDTVSTAVPTFPPQASASSGTSPSSEALKKAEDKKRKDKESKHKERDKAADKEHNKTSREFFASPSGNIVCVASPARVRCMIDNYSYDPPRRPKDCSLELWGSAVVANKKGAGFSCVKNPDIPESVETLPYGDSLSLHGMTCLSQRTGMRCTSDVSGKGFMIARGHVEFS